MNAGTCHTIPKEQGLSTPSPRLYSWDGGFKLASLACLWALSWWPWVAGWAQDGGDLTGGGVGVAWGVKGGGRNGVGI